MMPAAGIKTDSRGGERMKRNFASHGLIWAVLYGLLIAYGSLFTLGGWEAAHNPFAWLSGPLPRFVSRKDLYVNFIAYLPLGFLAARFLAARVSGPAIPGYSLLAGLCLSFVMESLQTFIPAREPSLVDLAANGAGALSGAVMARLSRTAGVGGALLRLRDNRLLPGRCSIIGAGVIMIWALARLSPNAMSLHRPGPLHKFSPLLLALQGNMPFNPAAALVHCCYAAGLALLAAAILRPDVKPFRLFALFAAFVLTARFFVVSGYLTLEEVAGYGAGTAIAVTVSRLPADLPRIVAMALLTAGFVLSELSPGQAATLSPEFNWLPFRCHLDNTLPAIGQILEGVWPFGALSLLMQRTVRRPGRFAAVCGGAAILLLVTLLEWRQLSVPGRTADITQALLATAGWCWPFYLRGKDLPYCQGDETGCRR